MPKWKKRSSIRRKSSRKTARLSKPIKRAVQSLILKKQETKSHYTSHVNFDYQNGDQVMALNSDIFSMPQGVTDGAPSSSGNRIGDRVDSIGFQIHYRVVPRATYTGGGTNTYQLPYIVCRLIVFVGNGTTSNTAGPTYGKICDVGAPINLASSTMVPLSADGGMIKKVLYDRRVILRNTGQFVNNGQITTNVGAGAFEFKKYFPYKKVIKYADNSIVGNQTTDPIYTCIMMEGCEAMNLPTGQVPLANVVGYCKVWFKDS